MPRLVSKKQVPSYKITSEDLNPILNHWIRLVEMVASTRTRVYSGVRKIVENVHWEIPGKALFGEHPIDYTDLCYVNRSKFGQLDRNYWNQEEADRLIAKVKERSHQPHTSVGMSLKAATKDSRSQGFCMQTLVMTKCDKKVTFDIFYRSTEVTQKFFADVLYMSTILRSRILEPCGLKPSDVTVVRYHFSNAYLSSVFMPIVLRLHPDPCAFLAGFRPADPKFHRTACMVIAKYLRTVNVYNYRTQKKQYEYCWKWVDKARMKALSTYVKPYIIKGESIPKPDDTEEEEDA